MKKQKNPIDKPFNDFWRLISPQDLLSRAGTVMMRKIPRQRFGSPALPRQAIIDSEIKEAAAQKEIYSVRLTGLRLYHELTILQIAGYKDLAKKLVYSGR